MEALAVHLMWIAAATYCALLAPKNLLATLIGVLGMAHFSLGKKLESKCKSTSFVKPILLLHALDLRELKYLKNSATDSSLKKN